LSPNFRQCARGTHQSPIDISTAEAVLNPALQPLHRDYTVANATLVDNVFNIAVCFFFFSKQKLLAIILV
jgi:carbonic anhydrase